MFPGGVSERPVPFVPFLSQVWEITTTAETPTPLRGRGATLPAQTGRSRGSSVRSTHAKVSKHCTQQSSFPFGHYSWH